MVWNRCLTLFTFAEENKNQNGEGGAVEVVIQIVAPEFENHRKFGATSRPAFGNVTRPKNSG